MNNLKIDTKNDLFNCVEKYSIYNNEKKGIDSKISVNTTGKIRSIHLIRLSYEFLIDFNFYLIRFLKRNTISWTNSWIDRWNVVKIWHLLGISMK